MGIFSFEFNNCQYRLNIQVTLTFEQQFAIWNGAMRRLALMIWLAAVDSSSWRDRG